MKPVLIILFMISSIAHSRCVCTATMGKNFYFERRAPNKIKCKDMLMSANLQAYQQGEICQANQKTFNLKWGCFEKNDKRPAYTSNSFSCDEVEGLVQAGDFMEAALLAQHLTSAKAVTPPTPNESTNCNNSGVGPSKSDQVVLKAKSKEDLRESLKKIGPLDSSKIGEIFDSVENGSISLSIYNDNGAGELIGIYGGDDVGNTHGIKLTISKAIGESGYNISFDYSSSLFTNFTTGDVSEEWEDEEGNRYATQNFIEENIAKLILEKEAKGEAFYWKASAGVHQLNKSNTKGTFGAFSALGNQNLWHKGFSSAIPGSARNYTNTPQSGDELAPMIELKAGKRFSTHDSKDSQAFIDGSIDTRITGVEKASFVGAQASINYDFTVSDQVARATAGVRSKVYVDGSQTHAPYAQVKLAGEQYEVGFRYEFYNGNAPDYQNALPEDFIFREEMSAKEDNLWHLYVKYKWK